MNSSIVLKNKLYELLSHQIFIRLPLKFYRTVSFFLQNLRRFDCNKPRSRLAMHRIHKYKKRGSGRQKWHLKKFWTLRRIGLELEIIKEEAAKEYLAEIENEDDSLECDEFGKPNNILMHKNSGTYFGLVKFPVNFSPSELALKRLCRGRTLQQIFPKQNDPNQRIATIASTVSTMANSSYVYNNRDSSESRLLKTELLNDCQRFENVDRIFGKTCTTSVEFFPKDTDEIEKENCSEQYAFRRNSDRRKCSKGISRKGSCKYQRKYWNCNKNSCRDRNCTVKEKFEGNFDKSSVPLFETENLSVENTFVHAPVDKLEDINSKNQTKQVFEQSASECSCKSEVNSNTTKTISRTYSSSEPDVQKNVLQKSNDGKSTYLSPMEVDSNMILIQSDLNTDVKKIDCSTNDHMNTLNAFEKSATKKEETTNATTRPGFIESSFKLFGKSLQNIFGITNFSNITKNVIIKHDLLKVEKDSKNIDLAIIAKSSDNFSTTFKSAEKTSNNSPTSTKDRGQSVGDLTSSNESSSCNDLTRGDIFVTDSKEIKLETEKHNMQENIKDVTLLCNLHLQPNSRDIHGEDTVNIQKNNTFENHRENKIPNRQPPYNRPHLNPTNHYHHLRHQLNPSTSCNHSSTSPQPSGLLPRYTVDMSGIVGQMFGNNSDRQEVVVPHKTIRSSRSRSGGFVQRRVTRKNVVQFDHNSLWTEFVSDMIVNSRVRKIPINGVGK